MSKNKGKSPIQEEINTEIEALETWMIEHLNAKCAEAEMTQKITEFEAYDVSGEDVFGIAIADDKTKIHFTIKPDKTELSMEKSKQKKGAANADG